MSKVEASIVHAYTEKLRELKAENDQLKAVLKDVKRVLNNALPTDNKLIILHKINLILK